MEARTMTTTLKSTIDSLTKLMDEYKTVSPRTERTRQLQLGGCIVKTAKAMWTQAGVEMPSLSDADKAAIESAFQAAQDQQHFYA